MSGWPGRTMILGAVLLVSGACTSSERLAGADRVRAVVLPYLSIAPFHIAAEEGFFAAEGLDVEFFHLGRNQEIMSALASGNVDVAAGMLTVNELSLAASGARIRMVAALGELAPAPCPFVAFLVRREMFDSGALDDPEQIRQLRFDIDPLIPMGFWADLLLRRHGLTLDDVELVNLPSPAAGEALRGGAIDVTGDSEPWTTRNTAAGDMVVWQAADDLTPGYAMSMLMYGPRLLDERPDVGDRFATAMLRAIRQFTQGKTPRNVDILSRATGLDADLLNALCWPRMREDGRINTASLLPYQDWNVAHGYVDRVLRDDELFDARFIERANAALASR